MKSLTLAELKQIARANGKLDGWDFSRLQVERTPVLWDYVEVARTYLKPADRVLDVGTGGGEIFLSLAPCFGEGIGIDHDPAMIRAARRNRSARSIDHISFKRMEAGHLQFDAEAFDVVLQRHSTVVAREIVRVLRRGGTYITQTVGERSSLNILDAFGWTPASFGPDWWQTVDGLAGEFRSLGCHVVAQAEIDLRCWYKDVESFLFWLMAVPWPEPIVLDRHWQAINRVLETCTTERGIETNEHRGLLVVQKL